MTCLKIPWNLCIPVPGMQFSKLTFLNSGKISFPMDLLASGNNLRARQQWEPAGLGAVKTQKCRESAETALALKVCGHLQSRQDTKAEGIVKIQCIRKSWEKRILEFALSWDSIMNHMFRNIFLQLLLFPQLEVSPQPALRSQRDCLPPFLSGPKNPCISQIFSLVLFSSKLAWQKNQILDDGYVLEDLLCLHASPV